MQVEEFGRFQLEATKVGRTVVFQVTVFRRTDPRREKLFAETQCSDPMHYIIQFVIRDETTLEGILKKFRLQLLHRGFVPVRVRLRTGKQWEGWSPIQLDDDELREMAPGLTAS
jgi:hypothetical protein